ncbi:MAG: N-acetylmuramoyl-L-alanine amidase [Muribaculaceae bacterium]
MMKRVKLHIFLVVAAMLLPQSVWAFTLVIDAGHGGRDKGAPGVHSYEKNINLAVALEFGDMVKRNLDGVDVVYTRDRDEYLTLQQRCDIANKQNGDLFVSIHTNSIAKSAKNRRTIHGSATYTLGLHRSEENLEVAKRENSVISLEDDYTTTYQGFDPTSPESYIMFELSQNIHMEQSVNFATMVQREFVQTAGRKDNGVRQAGFLVLARTSMPAVLVELDFICNPTQEDFLTSKRGKEKMARALYNAFERYLDGVQALKRQAAKSEAKATAGDSRNADVKEKPAKATAGDSRNADVKAVRATGKVEYKVQFLTSNKKYEEGAAQFKGLKGVECYRDKGLWKYTYGSAKSEKEALKILKGKVRPLFKQAFIVAFKDGERIL